MRIDKAFYRKALDRLLVAGGVDQDQARSVGNNLNWCDMVGRYNHGIERLPIMLRRVRKGGIKTPCEPIFRRVANAAASLDADSGFGHHASYLAMEQACEIARSHGVGVVGVHNSNFFGAASYYVNLAARNGMIGMALSNSYPKVAAHGGLFPVLGTNPLAIGVPRKNDRSIIIDMSTAALAGSTLREAQTKGEQLEPGLAIDEEGNPVTDPASAGGATLLPFGGAKGYGLALVVDLLAGVLTGAGFVDGVKSMYGDLEHGGANGHFMLAIDVSTWMNADQFDKRIDAMRESLRSSGKEGTVRFPGEARWAAYDESLASGIFIEDQTYRTLEQLAHELGVQLGWRG